jgi:hypothetical protein
MPVKDYVKLIEIILGTVMGVAIFYWGCYFGEPIRIIIGITITALYVRTLVKRHIALRQLKAWILANNDQPVLFYPSFFENQEKVKNNIVRDSTYPLIFIGYGNDGDMGDVKRSVVIELINQHKEIKMKYPSVFKFKGYQLINERLDELMDIEEKPIEVEVIRKKIDQVKNA